MEILIRGVALQPWFIADYTYKQQDQLLDLTCQTRFFASFPARPCFFQSKLNTCCHSLPFDIVEALSPTLFVSLKIDSLQSTFVSLLE